MSINVTIDALLRMYIFSNAKGVIHLYVFSVVLYVNCCVLCGVCREESGKNRDSQLACNGKLQGKQRRERKI